MSDIGDMAKLGFKIAGVFTAVAAVGIGTGGYYMHKNSVENRAEQRLTTRVQEELSNPFVQTVILNKVQKTEGCEATRPYGAAFTLKANDGKVTTGKVCTAPDKSSQFTFN